MKTDRCWSGQKQAPLFLLENTIRVVFWNCTLSRPTKTSNSPVRMHSGVSVFIFGMWIINMLTNHYSSFLAMVCYRQLSLYIAGLRLCSLGGSPARQPWTSRRVRGQCARRGQCVPFSRISKEWNGGKRWGWHRASVCFFICCFFLMFFWKGATYANMGQRSRVIYGCSSEVRHARYHKNSPMP